MSLNIVVTRKDNPLNKKIKKSSRMKVSIHNIKQNLKKKLRKRKNMISRTIMVSLIGMIIIMIKIITITMKKRDAKIMINMIEATMMLKIVLIKTEEIIRGITLYQALERIITTMIIGRIVSIFTTKKKAITRAVAFTRRKTMMEVDKEDINEWDTEGPRREHTKELVEEDIIM